MMITFKHSGNFDNLERFMNKKVNIMSLLHSYGREGVSALASATPVDTGLSAESWTYNIKTSGGKHTIIWKNYNTVNGTPVVIFIQYGHATTDGGYIEGIDFINPAIKPVFERMVKEIWKEVSL